MPLDISPHIYSQWASQLSLLSKITLRNFVCLTSSILRLSIVIQPMLRVKPLGVINMKLVLSIFKEGLLTLTHVKTWTSSMSILFTRRSNLSLMENTLVLSANNIGINKLETMGRSFMQSSVGFFIKSSCNLNIVYITWIYGWSDLTVYFYRSCAVTIYIHLGIRTTNIK